MVEAGAVDVVCAEDVALGGCADGDKRVRMSMGDGAMGEATY